MPRELAFYSPRMRGFLVRLMVPDGFDDFARMKSLTAKAISLMDSDEDVEDYPLDVAGCLAIQLALPGSTLIQRLRGESFLAREKFSVT